MFALLNLSKIRVDGDDIQEEDLGCARACMMIQSTYTTMWRRPERWQKVLQKGGKSVSDQVMEIIQSCGFVNSFCNSKECRYDSFFGVFWKE